MTVFFLYVLCLFPTQEENTILTFRSDQFRLGVISEYIEVEFSEERDSILSINYWSVYRSNNQTDTTAIEKLEVQNVDNFKGEEHGWKGELKFIESDPWLSFKIVEGVFEIDHGNNSFQVFEPEE